MPPGIIDPRDLTSTARTAALKQAVEHANPGALVPTCYDLTRSLTCSEIRRYVKDLRRGYP